MGHERLKRKLLVAVAGLLLPAAFFVRNNLGSENSAQPNTESKAEPTPTAQTGEAKSHARAVLLAGLVGEIMVTRPGSARETPIAVNTPIQEGFQLSSATDSSAIVVLEQDSTVIIGQHSKLLFDQLALDAEGNRLTGVIFDKGHAAFHFLPQHHSPSSKNQPGGTGAAQQTLPYADVYEIKAAEARVKVDGKCRFRIDVKRGFIRVEVFKGKLHFSTPVQSIKITAGESLEHPLGGRETAFNIHKGIAKDPWDRWAETQEQLALRAISATGKKNRQPEDLGAILRLRRSYPSTRGGELKRGPRAPHP